MVVWSDQATWFDGTITANGLAGGGFIETSGKVHLGTNDMASVSAGEGGTWLLNPCNVIIVVRTGATVAPGVNDPTPGAGDFRTVARSITDAAQPQ